MYVWDNLGSPATTHLRRTAFSTTCPPRLSGTSGSSSPRVVSAALFASLVERRVGGGGQVAGPRLRACSPSGRSFSGPCSYASRLGLAGRAPRCRRPATGGLAGAAARRADTRVQPARVRLPLHRPVATRLVGRRRLHPAPGSLAAGSPWIASFSRRARGLPERGRYPFRALELADGPDDCASARRCPWRAPPRRDPRRVLLRLGARRASRCSSCSSRSART